MNQIFFPCINLICLSIDDVLSFVLKTKCPLKINFILHYCFIYLYMITNLVSIDVDDDGDDPVQIIKIACHYRHRIASFFSTHWKLSWKKTGRWLASRLMISVWSIFGKFLFTLGNANFFPYIFQIEWNHIDLSKGARYVCSTSVIQFTYLYIKIYNKQKKNKSKITSKTYIQNF